MYNKLWDVDDSQTWANVSSPELWRFRNGQTGIYGTDPIAIAIVIMCITIVQWQRWSWASEAAAKAVAQIIYYLYILFYINITHEHGGEPVRRPADRKTETPNAW